MNIWGINALNHGSSLAVFDGPGGKLKHWEFCPSDELDSNLIRQFLTSGGPDHIYWYENPWVKKTRQLYAKQYETALDMSVMPKHYLKRARLDYAQLHYTPHHGSHAAAGYYTSPFNHCAIVVLDAIGEWDCASIWEGRHGEMKKVWSRRYPHSLGLLYSAFTKLVGLEPIKQEHLFQQMSDNGDPDRYYRDVLDYILPTINLQKNLHRGVLDWPYPIINLQDQCDIAAAVQSVFERNVESVMSLAQKLTGADCLVYMGGCAMNSKANRNIVEPMWKYIWSLPMPGDPSSAIGAVLYHTKHRVWDYKWQTVKHIEIKT
jgi:carbamoyltransferase